jgi:hypothetical protein
MAGPAVRNGRLWGIAVSALAVLAGLALAPMFGLGSSKWEPVAPKHVAALPELRDIAPYIEITDAVVYGFQDKVTRFRFTVRPPAAFDALLKDGSAFAAAKDSEATLYAVRASFEEAEGEPAWWTEMMREDNKRAALFVSTKTRARDVTLIRNNSGWYGQFTEY